MTLLNIERMLKREPVMRNVALALALILFIAIGPRPAAAHWYVSGFMPCGVVDCCFGSPKVVKRKAAYRSYRKADHYRRSVGRFDSLNGFIPEIASRRAACCGY